MNERKKEMKLEFILAAMANCGKRSPLPGQAAWRCGRGARLGYGASVALRHAFAAVLFLAVSGLAQTPEPPIPSGLTFPDIVGKALSGSDITVGMRDGSPKVLVMTFTRGAASSAQAWLDACRADETTLKVPSPPDGSPPPRVVCYDVRMVQGIPRIIRGYVEGRMKKGLSPEQLAHTVLVYRDEEAWRGRMTVKPDNESEPFVVMVDRQGRVQSLLQGAFNPVALKAGQARLLAN